MKIGDVVFLKSGSPSLTIVDIDDYNGDITVKWISHDAVYQYTFPAICLTTSITIFN